MSFRSFIKTQETSFIEPASSIPERTLLPNEIGSITCNDVSFCFQFEDVLKGKLTCSNMCLFFTPFKKPQKNLPPRSSIIDESVCIPLCSIQRIFYATVHQNVQLSASKKKYNLLSHSLSSLDFVSCLKIYLKDFRVITIDLTKSQHAPNLANNLLHFSRPTSIDLVMQTGALCEWNTKIDYNDEESWIRELKSCGITKNWRVCSLRRELTSAAIHSYPMYVVVPATCTAFEIGGMIERWRGGRFPVWTWSAGNGRMLLRSSTFEDNDNSQSIYKQFCMQVLQNGGQPLHEILIDASLTPEKISACYQKLHKMCSIDSQKLFETREKTWLLRLHDTGWSQLILYCMKATEECVRAFRDYGKSVIIFEKSGYDLSPIISSLAQICMSSTFRSASGFESMIAKEWIALGHPFGQRNLCIGNSPSDDDELQTAPFFLLFLDCVAQLRRLYPMHFNYSDHLLIGLWDLCLTGFVPAFACSSVDEQLSSKKTGGPFPLRRFYSEEYRRLFSNVVNDASQVMEEVARKRKQNTMYTSLPKSPKGHIALPLADEILQPPTTSIDIELWEACYLRWIKPCTISNGGSIYADLALDNVMETVANRYNCSWKSQYKSVELPVCSAYPYSDATNGSKVRREMDTDEYNDTYSVASLSLRETPLMNTSLGVDREPRAMLTPTRRAPERPNMELNYNRTTF